MKSAMLVTGIIVIISSFGCGSSGPTIRHYSARFDVYGALFSEYSDRGFLFTPYTYEGEYEAIGMLTFEMLPEANWVGDDDYVLNSGAWEESVRPHWRVDSLITIEVALDSVYNHCVEIGADAMVDVRVERLSTSVREGLEVSGFLIRRI